MDHFAYGERVAREAEIRRVMYTDYMPDRGLDSSLEGRIDALEEHIDFLVDILNALLDHMYGPDDLGKPETILKVVKDYVARKD